MEGRFEQLRAHYGLPEEIVEGSEGVRGALPEIRSDQLFVLTTELDDGHRSLGRLGGHVANTVHEERQPGLPIPVVADRLEPIDVFIAVLLEEERRIQERSAQDALLREPERDQEPSGPTVPVEEWMDRLELGMCEADLDEGRHRCRIMEEALKVAEGFLGGLPRWGNEPRGCG